MNDFDYTVHLITIQNHLNLLESLTGNQKLKQAKQLISEMIQESLKENTTVN